MFLTSSYYARPSNDHTSATKFFSDAKNFFQDEVVSLTKKITFTELKRARLILDISKQEVVKCSGYYKDGVLVTTPHYDELFKYFNKLYPTQIKSTLEQVA